MTPKPKVKERGPSVVAKLETRLLAVEHRLGIDHTAIAADAEASLEAGALAAPLSEPHVEGEAE